MRDFFKVFGVFLFVCLAAPAFCAQDPLYLELSAHGDKIDLGLAEFASSRSVAEESKLAGEIREIVRNDLLFSRAFQVLEGGPASVGRKSAFPGWRTLGADALVTGYVNTAWFGRWQFEGLLEDVGTGEKILEKKYVVEFGQERKVAHEWADEVIRYFSGQAGIAHSQVVFVNDATGKKEVCVVDYDGHGFRRITDDRSIALLPKFSPDGRWIAYTAYREGTPVLYLLSPDGRQKKTLCRYEGLNSAAAWLPDGKSLVATLSMGRDPNLYWVDLEGRVLRVLTQAGAIDTAPTLSADGLRLAFTSDRPGKPQIYTMDMNGSNLKRLSQSGLCDSPAWSPQGPLVAFACSEGGGNFDIYTVDTGSQDRRRLTWGEGDSENPGWSPDGRFLVFTSTRRGKAELWIMGEDGSNPHPLGDLPGQSYSPHWGP